MKGIIAERLEDLLRSVDDANVVARRKGAGHEGREGCGDQRDAADGR